MLYDKRWDKQIAADPLTLEALIGWLEMCDPKRAYNFGDCAACLAAQYHNYLGREYRPAIGWPNAPDFPSQLEWVAVNGKWTFGAALERARELLTDASTEKV